MSGFPPGHGPAGKATLTGFLKHPVNQPINLYQNFFVKIPKTYKSNFIPLQKMVRVTIGLT